MTCSIQPVAKILVGSGNAITGVLLADGSEVRAAAVLSNATPKTTFLDLLPKVSTEYLVALLARLTSNAYPRRIYVETSENT